MTQAVIGEKIPLLAHLECDEGEVVFVEAVLKDPDRVAVAGSPVDLTDEGDGIFFDDSLNMPDRPFVTVTYNIYEDAGKTIPSSEFCPISEIITSASGGGSGSVVVTNTPDRIVGRVKDERLAFKIDDPGPAKAMISDPDAKLKSLDEQSTIEENQDMHIIRSQ